MSAPADWSVVRALFEAAVELPPTEREALLAQRCGDDRAMRAAVEALLLADSDVALPDLQPSTAGIGRSGDLLGADGTVEIGGFVVRRLIATGGMGAVYEAEQQNPRRSVALKVLRPELCTGATLQRFRVEAEVLGRLQHPGIAEVHAAGVHLTRSGPFELELPWYALELLPSSASLTEHAQRLALDVHARVALVRAICEAVHHAHLRGVIHRDLKPGNILVGLDGQPKIVDFGIARVADESCTDALTAPGMVLGTPAYMAPEQRSGEPDVDLRCDVFALGVVLLELLTGSRRRAMQTPAMLALRA